MPHTWAGKTVVISGGSKGLGAQLALEAASQKARVLIIGRDPSSLDKTAEKLRNAGATEVISVPTDAIQLASSEAFHQAVKKSGIDLLINAIGRSDRGVLAQLSVEEFERMFHDNVTIGMVVTRTCLPYLEQQKGAVVNIGSLAGIIAAPYLGSYCASKFALTAVSRQWRAELRPRGVHVMLVSTGPIDREDSHQRYNELVEKRGDLPEQAKSPGGGAKLKRIDPTVLSQRILSEASRRTPEIVVPFKAKILAALSPLFPSLADYLVGKNTGK